MPSNYEDTSLWKRSFSPDRWPNQNTEIERFKTSYRSFREKIKELVSLIHADLPNLTLHDITHLDSLWEIASLIAGSESDLNPLEAYILGGAILLHDAALTFEAYDGGLDKIRETTLWKDVFAEESKNEDQEEATAKAACDFVAMRGLHAAQAATLASKKWTSSNSPDGFHLIDDSHLRIHLGELIGKIAASHHWNIEDVKSNLGLQFNPPGELHQDLTVRPLKIACLLRCADALHIDNRRAPDFFHALLKREGVSLSHWQAQNRIARPSVDVSDPTSSTILVTSTSSFPMIEASAWWVMFDAISVANQELKDSNDLLVKYSNSAFQMKKIKGAGSPEEMLSLIRPDGWTPTMASIHVSNVKRLVETLGGEQLYSTAADKLFVVFRELIQNARDAICARRQFDPDFEGQITIRKVGDDSDISLIVEDDGVGMSNRVITGPLLDFGTSFWASNLARERFPGLQSSGYRSVGKYGIGFYSIFMVAAEVSITSRDYQDGQDQATTLLFNNGLTLRPIIQKGAIPGFHQSTQVALKLTEEAHAFLPVSIKRNLMGTTGFTTTLEQFLSALCAGLDVKVNFINDDEVMTCVHSPLPLEVEEGIEWLNEISFSRSQNDAVVNEYIMAN